MSKHPAKPLMAHMAQPAEAKAVKLPKTQNSVAKPP
jgi:hypothetical protein